MTSKDDSWIPVEKISSMGNGFTFELETLIFWALTKSVCEVNEETSARVIVYGDDILCPSKVMPQLLEVFDFCGFSINTEKTHYQTPFRESCGKHYFMGEDVSPIYQKELPNDLGEAYRLANRVRRLALDWGGGHFCDSTLRPAWLAATRDRRIGLQPRHVVPLDSEDDDGLALPMDELRPFIVHIVHEDPKLPLWGYKLNVLSFKGKSVAVDDGSALLAYSLRFGGAPEYGPKGIGVSHNHCSPVEPGRLWPTALNGPLIKGAHWTRTDVSTRGMQSYVMRLTESTAFNSRVPVRRRGRYVSRRRQYHVCSNAPWL